jgi:hypothetical protein
MGAGAFASAKGKRVERAAVNLLQPVIDKVYGGLGIEIPKLFRNGYLAAADGGYDIGGLDWLAFEIKGCETLCIPKWWKQCVRQAKPEQIPVLLYKQNRRAWKCVMFGYLHVRKGKRVKARIEVDIDTFLTWFEAKLISELESEHV